MGDVLQFILGVIIVIGIFMALEYITPSARKERKIIEYRFYYFFKICNNIIGSGKSYKTSNFHVEFKSDIRNQIEKIGDYTVKASFSSTNSKFPYMINMTAFIRDFKCGEQCSEYLKFLTEDVCEKEITEMLNKIKSSEKFKSSFYHAQIR